MTRLSLSPLSVRQQVRARFHNLTLYSAFNAVLRLKLEIFFMLIRLHYGVCNCCTSSKSARSVSGCVSFGRSMPGSVRFSSGHGSAESQNIAVQDEDEFVAVVLNLYAQVNCKKRRKFEDQLRNKFLCFQYSSI